jgi:hypothetical protein
MQQFFVEWKNVIERAYEATPTTSSMHPSMNEETLKSDRSDTKHNDMSDCPTVLVCAKILSRTRRPRYVGSKCLL